MSLCFRWMSEVAMKMWIPGRFAFSTARMARSTSCSRGRASERTIGFTTAWATRRTDSKSPSEEAAKPASITSTPRCSSWRAIASFSSTFMVAPGDVSPSRRGVSKICTRSIVGLLYASPSRKTPGATNRPARGPRNKKATGGVVPPVASSEEGEGLALHASEGRGRAAKQQAQGQSKECGLLDHQNERLPALSGLVKHDRAHRGRLGAGGGLQRVSGQTAHEGHDRPGERIAPDAEEEHHLGRAHGQVDENDQPEQDRERMAVMEADLLERVVPDLAHHEPRHPEDDEQHHDVLAGLALAAEPEVEEHGGGDHAGRRRDGEADEVPLLARGDLHVEAREAERAAGHVERGGEPAPASPRPERPLVDEDAGRHAEGDQVGERVVLDAEGAGRARESRQAPG